MWLAAYSLVLALVLFASERYTGFQARQSEGL